MFILIAIATFCLIFGLFFFFVGFSKSGMERERDGFIMCLGIIFIALSASFIDIMGLI